MSADFASPDGSAGGKGGRVGNVSNPSKGRLAAELGVDATLLRRFVDDHARPTAPCGKKLELSNCLPHGELAAHPEQLRDDVERASATIDAVGGVDR